jgi:nucleolar GTP-binding protein
MNFEKLPSVETAQFFIDGAFKSGARITNNLFETAKSRSPRNMNRFESERILAMCDFVESHFKNIIASYPNFDNLPEIYTQLVKLQLDMAAIKKHLGAVNWCKDQIHTLGKDHAKRMLKARNKETVAAIKNAFFGRFSSLIKQIKDDLPPLEAARRIMKKFPDVKTDCPTVCIAGFPSVGKSTILSKITTAKPEIASWDFTTKRLNIGYFTYRLQQIQLIDTPGTLHRERMNDIEKQAHLAMKYLAELIIFVFDPTSKYDEATQLKLLDSVRDYDKEYLIYISKTDLIDDETLKSVLKRFPGAITDTTALKQAIVAHVSKR